MYATNAAAKLLNKIIFCFPFVSNMCGLTLSVFPCS